MATKQSKVKVAMVFHQESDDELALTCTSVDTGFTKNMILFPSPPVDLPTFRDQSALYAAAVVAAKDGGRKAVAEKNKLRAGITKMLSKQGRYVDEVANNDLTIIAASGFQPNTGAAPAQQTPKAGIDKLVQGNSGEIVVTPTPVGARMYEKRWGTPGAGGAAPTSWTIVQAASARPGTRITGLTPGTLYVFQVRAYGKWGWTEWSDPVTKMST